MKLTNKQGQPVNTGDVVRTFKGDIVIITGWREPQHENSTGRIYVMSTDGRQTHSEYFPAVCDMEFGSP
jgi:hypothetical protein